MTEDDDPIEAAYKMRREGTKWSTISAALVIPRSTIHKAVKNRLQPSEHVTIRKVVTHGLCSSEKSRVHYIQMPRIPTIDGHYVASNDNNMAPAKSA